MAPTENPNCPPTEWSWHDTGKMPLANKKISKYTAIQDVPADTETGNSSRLKDCWYHARLRDFLHHGFVYDAPIPIGENSPHNLIYPLVLGGNHGSRSMWMRLCLYDITWMRLYNIMAIYTKPWDNQTMMFFYIYYSVTVEQPANLKDRSFAS
jgi:hypothetical protein